MNLVFFFFSMQGHVHASRCTIFDSRSPGLSAFHPGRVKKKGLSYTGTHRSRVPGGCMATPPETRAGTPGTGITGITGPVGEVKTMAENKV